MAIIYGVNPIKEALSAEKTTIEKILVAKGVKGKASAKIISAAGRLGIPVERVSTAELDRVTGVSKHQGLTALMSGGYGYSSLEEILVAVKKSRDKGERALILVLDSIKDPGNLGSLIRTASCAGVIGVIIPRDRACPVTPAVAKASAGAVSHIRVARVTNLARSIRELKEFNIWTVALEADGKGNIYATDLSGDIAIVVGGEESGVRRLVREACDECAAIPIIGPVNSLNAAQAGGIALFEAMRQDKNARQ